MAGKQPESEQPVELPPQGIGPERKMSEIAKIRALVKECTDLPFAVFMISPDLVELDFARHDEAFDKHNADGLMWSIHWMLGKLETKLSCPHLGEKSDIHLSVTLPTAIFNGNHHCGELQGVEHED